MTMLPAHNVHAILCTPERILGQVQDVTFESQDAILRTVTVTISVTLTPDPNVNPERITSP